MTQSTMRAIEILLVCVVNLVRLLPLLLLMMMMMLLPWLLYHVQFLLGDKTLSPNSFPSLYAIALLEVDLELEPCNSIADNVELCRALARMAPLDLYPSAVLDRCEIIQAKNMKLINGFEKKFIVFHLFCSFAYRFPRYC